MRIRVTKAGPGCSFQPGQVLKTSDHKAKELVEKGFAVAVAEAVSVDDSVEKMQAANTVKEPLPVVAMQPPRHICGCGLVCKDKEELRVHREVC